MKNQFWQKKRCRTLTTLDTFKSKSRIIYADKPIKNEQACEELDHADNFVSMQNVR